MARDRPCAGLDRRSRRPDHDGFVEYFKATPRGLSNQGWKDSYDSVFHADGRLAEGPIALAEVQGYVYAAKQLASWSADQLGFTERARRLDIEAAHLARRFDDAFWCEEIGTYALALDGDKQPCCVATSNAGQVLMSGIARGDSAERIAEQLMEPDFFSGWGVRTVAVREARYNPMSYHNGSVWPHDNAMIATGLARYGDSHAIARIFQGMFEATWTCGACRSCSAAFPVFVVADRRSIQSPAHRRRGQAVSFLHSCRPRSASSKPPLRRSSDFAIRSCRPFSTASFCVDSRRAQEVSIFQCTVITMTRSPLEFWRHAAAISKSLRGNHRS
jgi:hypothetical protein